MLDKEDEISFPNNIQPLWQQHSEDDLSIQQPIY